MLLGNYNGTPARPVTILEGIKSVAGTNVQVFYESGCPLALRNENAAPTNNALWMKAIEAAQLADVVIYVGGISPPNLKARRCA